MLTLVITALSFFLCLLLFGTLSHSQSTLFRSTQDGFGFSVLRRNGRKGLNCTVPPSSPALMTDRTNWPSGFAGGAFEGAVFDGSSIWLVPFSAAEVVRIKLPGKAMSIYNRWPSGVSGSGFSGGVFTGRFIWLIHCQICRPTRSCER